jgi:hypothetical protein
MTSDELELTDLGDAVRETRQCSPEPPFYWDSTFVWGSCPNRLVRKP